MPSLFDTVVISAAVSAAVTMLGWFAAHWSSIRLEESRRIEKILDVQTALLADIESNLSRYAEIDLDAHLKSITDRILKPGAGKTFTPFVPRDAIEVVFEAIIADIHILPTAVIGDVVGYYKQEYKLRELIIDLRSDRYAGLEPDRKAQIYRDYIWQVKTVIYSGTEAANNLSRSLGREPTARLISNPATGRSPASESP